MRQIIIFSFQSKDIYLMLCLAPHAPTWFANLNEEDKTNIVALLSQGIEQYGRFSQDVKQDLVTEFQIEDFQAVELYKFVYHSRNLFF